MKSVLIIGMGRLGRHLALKMTELKNEVVIVDKDADVIEELAPHFTDAQIGDCTNENVLRALGVNNFDICFVTIGDNFQSSLEITSLLKELGAQYVISKARRDIQAKFLLRNGADEVVYPEREVAEKLAIRCSATKVFDRIDLSPDFAIFELPVMRTWIGRDMYSIDVRKRYHLNIIAIKHAGKIMPAAPELAYLFQEGDHVIVAGNPNDLSKFASKF